MTSQLTREPRALSGRKILQSLKAWRDEQARREGVEAFRVLPNATLEALVSAVPRTREDLLRVKGIKEAKQRKYGKALLEIVGRDLKMDDGRLKNRILDAEQHTNDFTETLIQSLASNPDLPSSNIEHPPSNVLTVSQFLDSLNAELSGLAARIRGEVTELNHWKGRYIFFSIKDKEGEGVLRCVMSVERSRVFGVDMAIGDEVIVEGFPSVYKPRGELSFQVGTLEYAGEGALKKAYEVLLAKLGTEGLLAPERKRLLPDFPQRIALITSRDGAAIDDFRMNLVAMGLRIDFYPTLVEGSRAVFEIIEALQYFEKRHQQYDLLVIVRGGGSLESLQAFNNETLVRTIAHLSIPTLLGVGHERDVTLASLVADRMVSTPTAAARTISQPFEEARVRLNQLIRILPECFERQVVAVRHQLRGRTLHLSEHLQRLLISVRSLEQRLRERLFPLRERLLVLTEDVNAAYERLMHSFQRNFVASREQLSALEQLLRQYDPERLLALGYSLVRSGSKVLRSAKGLHPGDELTIQFGDGQVESEVKRIHDA